MHFIIAQKLQVQVYEALSFDIKDQGHQSCILDVILEIHEILYLIDQSINDAI